MSNDFGRIDKMEVISQLMVDDLETYLLPISFANDVSEEVSFQGDSVTVHLYENNAAPSVQNISGGSINYSNTKSDLTLTPVNVPLEWYASDGYDIPELVWTKSVAKDLNRFASKKVYQAAKNIVTDVISLIDSAYSSTVSVSGSGNTKYTWTTHQEATLKACYDNDMNPEETTVVLDNKSFTELVGSLPTLAGVNKDDVLKSGVIDEVGGTRIVRSPIVPAGTRGFAATKDALAMAMRPLAPLQAELSSGQSMLATSGNGLTVRTRRYQSPDTGLISVRFDALYGRKQFNTSAAVRILN